MRVTLLNGLKKTQKGTFDVLEILADIKNGKYSQSVFDCRVALKLNKKAYAREKELLPCFTPSGRFAQAYSTKKGSSYPIPPVRKDLIEYFGVVVLDYDKLDTMDLACLADVVGKDKYTFSGFVSPSNHGYKVLVKTSNKDPKRHAEVFQAVRAYYKKLTGIEDDKSSSNFNRLCFVSVDPLLYLNENSEVFAFQPSLFEEKPKVAKKPISVAPSTKGMERTVKALNRVQNNGYNYVEGQRHVFVKQLAIECVKYGVSEKECIEFVDSNFISADCDAAKVLDVVGWAYNNIKEVGIYEDWANENKSPAPQTPTPKKEEYLPELYKAKKAKNGGGVITIPEVEDEDFNSLPQKSRDAITFQRVVEETLNKFFDFRINTLKHREEYKLKEWDTFQEMDKLEYNSIARALRLNGVNCTPAKLEGIILSHFSKQVHPLKELFERWNDKVLDDNIDYIKQVASLVKTDAPKGLFETIFKKWLVASVANVYVEGQCTNHHCLILCGKQETNKTTFLSSLFSSEYTFIGHVDLKNKDARIMLADTFMVLLDEQFAVIDKETDWETLKSMVTVPRIKDRWVYSKTSKLAPRIANFCGTTNRIEILQDDTGNRRFIPFQLTAPIDINGLRKIDITAMWAQAYRLYVEGWHYLPTRKEKNQIEKYQQKFKKLGTEHHLIMDTFEPCEKDDKELRLMKGVEIWKWLNKEYSLHKEVTPNKISRAMGFLGFVQKKLTRDEDKRRAMYWLVKAV